MPEIIPPDNNSSEVALQNGIELQRLNAKGTQQQKVPPGTYQISYAAKKKDIAPPECMTFIWLVTAMDLNCLCIGHQTLDVTDLIIEGNGTNEVIYYVPKCIIAVLVIVCFAVSFVGIVSNQMSRSPNILAQRSIFWPNAVSLIFSSGRIFLGQLQNGITDEILNLIREDKLAEVVIITATNRPFVSYFTSIFLILTLFLGIFKRHVPSTRETDKEAGLGTHREIFKELIEKIGEDADKKLCEELALGNRFQKIRSDCHLVTFELLFFS